jgi:hypothetical protein
MGRFLRLLLEAVTRLPAVLRQLPRLGADLRAVWRAVCESLRRLRRGEWPPRPGRERCCVRVPDVYVRPDPLLYAQHYLMARGVAVTWDNPDIQLHDGGVPVPSASLLPDHEYEVRVRVWNGSYDAPAVGVGVSLSFLSFGIATTSQPIPPTQYVTLGVKGSAQHPAYATFRWRTPAAAGHYCLQARLHWHDDANPDNNLGQENVIVGALASPAEVAFRLRNDASVRRRFVLEADAYRLPPAWPCDEDDGDGPGGGERYPTRLAESRARWAWALRTQAYGEFPVPGDWSVAITPADPVLDAGEEREVRVAIEPRDPGFRGTKAFNVHGFALGPDGTRDLVGGVTITVSR